MPTSQGESAASGAPQSMTLRELEKWAILASMQRTGNNLMAVCRELDVGRTTLYRKLRNYGWRRPGSTP